MCTGTFQEGDSNVRPPPGTLCSSACIIESGRWGETWCWTDGGNWGAECVPCQGRQDHICDYINTILIRYLEFDNAFKIMSYRMLAR